MSYQRKLKNYKDNHIETAVSEATPHRLIEMLFENLLKNLGLTKRFIDKKQHEKKSRFSGKCISILSALREGLDFDSSQEVSSNLDALYAYCSRLVFEASSKNDNSLIDEVISLIQPISDSWSNMPEGIRQASREKVESIKKTKGKKQEA
jgi:flagellar protein FliS